MTLNFIQIRERLYEFVKEKLGSTHYLTLGRALELAISLIIANELQKAKLTLNKTIRVATKVLGGKDGLVLRAYEIYGLCLMRD